MPHDDESCAQNRRRVIEAARRAFMEEGYRASMESIATRAGVAKQTLYNHFSCKQELFGEAARLFSEAITVALEGGTENLRETLLRFGATFRQRALGDEGLAMFRALTAEASRLPDLTSGFLCKGHDPTEECLSTLLGNAMAEGKLRQDDPVFAAEMLMSMLAGVDHVRRLCAAPLRDEPEETRIQRIVDCFLRAFAPPR